jgi:hypothetical protein
MSMNRTKIGRSISIMTTEPEATLQPDPLASLGDAIESAAGSFNHAAANASASAKAAAQKVKTTANSGAYHAAYGVAYGVVFGAVFLVELLPENNVFRRGFEDGAEEGFDAAIAKSAERRAKRRTLIEAEEELDFDDEVEAHASEEAAPATKKRTRAAAAK